MKTIIEIPDALAQQAKALARSQGRTLRDPVVAALAAEVERRSHVSRPFTFTTVDGQGLQDGVLEADLVERVLWRRP